MSDLEKLKKASAMALDIFRATNDGDNLPPAELKLVENALNGFLNEAGEAAFARLHARIKGGANA